MKSLLLGIILTSCTVQPAHALRLSVDDSQEFKTHALASVCFEVMEPLDKRVGAFFDSVAFSIEMANDDVSGLLDSSFEEQALLYTYNDVEALVERCEGIVDNM